jgi:hypothetical protein
MIYVIRDKSSQSYLQEDGEYANNDQDARCFFDIDHVKSEATDRDEIIGLEGDEPPQVIQ